MWMHSEKKIRTGFQVDVYYYTNTWQEQYKPRNTITLERNETYNIQ